MQIFEFRDEVVGDYAEYIESFISIADPEIRKAVDQALQNGLLWRDPLVQINPNFAPGKQIDDLVAEGHFIRSAEGFSGEAKRRRKAPVTHSNYTFTKKKPSGLPIKRKTTSFVPGPDPASPYPTSFRLLTTCCGPGLAAA